MNLFVLFCRTKNCIKRLLATNIAYDDDRVKNCLIKILVQVGIRVPMCLMSDNESFVVIHTAFVVTNMEPQTEVGEIKYLRITIKYKASIRADNLKEWDGMQHCMRCRAGLNKEL